MFIYVCRNSEVPRLNATAGISHYTPRTKQSGKVYMQLLDFPQFCMEIRRDLRDAALERKRHGDLFSLTFYVRERERDGRAAINLAERLSVFEHSNNSITILPRRVLPSSRFYSPSLSLSPVSCPVFRNDRLTRARTNSHLPCTHRHLPVMLPSTRHACRLPDPLPRSNYY